MVNRVVGSVFRYWRERTASAAPLAPRCRALPRPSGACVSFVARTHSLSAVAQVAVRSLLWRTSLWAMTRRPSGAGTDGSDCRVLRGGSRVTHRALRSSNTRDSICLQPRRGEVQQPTPKFAGVLRRRLSCGKGASITFEPRRGEVSLAPPHPNPTPKQKTADPGPRTVDLLP